MTPALNHPADIHEHHGSDVGEDDVPTVVEGAAAPPPVICTYYCPPTDVKVQREGNGRCGDCGIYTCSIVRNDHGVVTEHKPLTNEYVLQGRCLLCHPLPRQLKEAAAESEKAPESAQEEDAATPASETTMAAAESSAAGPDNCGEATAEATEENTKDENPAVVFDSDDFVFLPSNPYVDELQAALDPSSDYSAMSALEKISDIVCVDDEAKANQNRLEIAAGGGIETIVATMNAHPTYACLKRQVCTVLADLAGNEDNKLKLAVGKQSTITTVLLAMKAHPYDAGLQQSACKLLWLLATNKESRVTLAKAGSVTAILLAMKRHYFQPNLQEYACMALWDFTKDENHKCLVAKTGGILALVAAMKAYPNNASLQKCACGALLNLTGNEENESRIVQAGGVALLVQKIAKRSGKVCYQEIELLEFASGALNNLASNEDNRKLIVEAGGIEAVSELISRLMRDSAAKSNRYGLKDSVAKSDRYTTLRAYASETLEKLQQEGNVSGSGTESVFGTALP